MIPDVANDHFTSYNFEVGTRSEASSGTSTTVMHAAVLFLQSYSAATEAKLVFSHQWHADIAPNSEYM